MELQVFVPVPADRLREALADAVRVARAVPGLQQDAGAAPVAGRLKLRVGGHSVTYRGTLAVSPRADGTYAVRADGTESRGAGTVTLSLTLTLAPAESGTTVIAGGTAKAEGRLAELPADAVTTAANRLLTRTLETLAAATTEGTGPAQAEDASQPEQQAQDEAAEPTRQAEANPSEPGPHGQGNAAEPGRQAQANPSEPGPHGQGNAAEPGRQAQAKPSEPGPQGQDEAAEPTRQAQANPSEPGPHGQGNAAEPGRPAEGNAADPRPHAEAAHEPTPHAGDEPADPAEPHAEDGDEPAPGRQADAEPADEKPGTQAPSAFDGDVPPPSLDPETDAAIPDTVPDGLEVRAEPPAEAAHARRTMIGRSAEEVDHAPPRGRYAPVPAPQTVTASPVLRWAAPAAAVAVASAIVVARALRRRH
ncbi:SRPBCC domain-containing protein [Streptomyces griseoluteus]|uniref:SRPBCC domain-containing protein n=1 Tax=Streptomyces griseoluteus TaxID=29306 RepID=UPI00331FAA12